jgi:hypothetical protein
VNTSPAPVARPFKGFTFHGCAHCGLPRRLHAPRRIAVRHGACNAFLPLVDPVSHACLRAAVAESDPVENPLRAIARAFFRGLLS